MDSLALESRCKIVSDIYKVSRDLMLLWFDSARAGDLKTMKQLYKNVTSKSIETQKKQHPLVHATGEGTSYGFVGSTALHWAAANGDMTMMNKLFEWGASPNAQNKGGSTPLHSACSNLRSDSASLLLQRGANPDLTDCCNETPADVLQNRLRIEIEENGGGRANAPTKKIVDEILKLLRLQSLGRSLLMKSSSDSGKNKEAHDDRSAESSSSISKSWDVASMKKFVVGCRLVEREEECPKEREELVKHCEMALGHFSLQLDLAASSDSAFEKLKAECEGKIQKRLLKLENKKEAKRIKKTGDAGNDDDLPEDNDDQDDEDEEQRELEMLSAKASSFSDKGNESFNKGDYKTAVQHYTKALSIFPHESKYYSNRSAAYLKLGKATAKKALDDAKTAASLKPD